MAGVFYHGAVFARRVLRLRFFEAACADVDAGGVLCVAVCGQKVEDAPFLPPDGWAGDEVAAVGGMLRAEVVEGVEAAVGVAVEGLLRAVDGVAAGEQRREFFGKEARELCGSAVCAAGQKS